MDAIRRAELEQEKAKLLIELEAVGAMEAVWEQAAQKAALEQERRKKEEQELIKRRDILRLLVEAASDQATSAREDYLKLQAQGSLMIGSKVEETERLQSIRQLLHESHAEQVASNQEMVEKYNDAPWVKALKKKEEQLARTKQHVKEKEAEAAELALEVARLRDWVDDEIENPTCKFVAEVAALELWRQKKDEERQMADKKQHLDGSLEQQGSNDSPHLYPKKDVADESYALYINNTASSDDDTEIDGDGSSSGIDESQEGGESRKSVTTGYIVAESPDAHAIHSNLLADAASLRFSSSLLSPSLNATPADTTLLLEREYEEAENNTQQITDDKESGDRRQSTRYNTITPQTSSQFENFLQNAIIADLSRDDKPANPDAPPRTFTSFGSCYIDNWPSVISSAEWRNIGMTNMHYVNGLCEGQLRRCDASYPRAERISSVFISDISLFSKRQCMPNTAQLSIDYPSYWSVLNTTLETFPTTNRILRAFVVSVGLEFCLRFKDFATAENELLNFYNSFFAMYETTFASSYTVFQCNGSRSGTVEVTSAPPTVIVLTVPLIMNGMQYPTESVKQINARIRKIVAEKKPKIPMIELYDWEAATNDLVEFNQENFWERFRRLFVALHEYNVFTF